MEDVKNLKINELKALAKENHIKGWYDMKKVELISKLEEVLSEEPEQPEKTPLEEVITSIEEDKKADTDDSGAPEDEPKPHRRGKLITFNGKSQNLESWAKELNVTPQLLYGRLYVSGWSVEKAFTTPSKRKKDKGATAHES